MVAPFSAGLRECNQCHTVRPLDAFYKRTGCKSDTHRKECKACFLAKCGDRYRKNPELFRKRDVRWKEANRDRWRRYQADWYLANKERHREQASAWYQKNAEMSKAYVRSWQLENRDRVNEYHRRRRARKAIGSYGTPTQEQLLGKLAFWGFRCWICGTTGRLEFDHVKPLAKGGVHILANIRPACKPCNSAKSDKWPFELARRA